MYNVCIYNVQIYIHVCISLYTYHATYMHCTVFHELILCHISLSLPPSHPPSEFVIQRAEKHGGNASYTVYVELEQAYAKEEIFPLDLKNAVARELSKVCILYTCTCTMYMYVGIVLYMYVYNACINVYVCILVPRPSPLCLFARL